MAAAAQQAPAAAVDQYLNRISDESIAVLQRFGPEAPSKLNAYAVNVENALLESLGHQHRQAEALQEQQQFIAQAQQVMEQAIVERKAMMHILSDPETLADYTTRFFGPGGVMPVETPEESSRTRLQEGMFSQQGGNMIPTFNAGDFEPGQVARQAAMPSPDQSQLPQGPRGGVWESFQHAAANDITKAWQVLDSAQPSALRGKILFAE